LNPYSDNVFSFDNPIAYGSFFEYTLSPQRRDLIRILNIEYSAFFRVLGYSDYRFRLVPLRTLLPNLERLVITGLWGLDWEDRKEVSGAILNVIYKCAAPSRFFLFDPRHPRDKGLRVEVVERVSHTDKIEPWQTYVVPGTSE
jgi:hypothetical protein